MNNKKRTFKEELKLMARGFKILHSIDKFYIQMTIIKEIAGEILPFVNLYMSALIITAIAKSEDFKKLLIYALLTVSINLSVKVIQNLITRKYNIHDRALWNKLYAFYADVNNNMQYEHLENPDVYSHRHRIDQNQNSGGGGIMRIAWRLATIVRNIFSLICAASLTAGMFITQADGNFIGIFAFVNSPISVIIIIFMIILNTVVSIMCEKKQSQGEFKQMAVWSERNKAYWYYQDLIRGEYTYGMDIRLFKQKTVILEENEKQLLVDDENLRSINKLPYKYSRIRQLLSASMNIILYLYVAAKAYIGAFEIGGFVMYTGAIWRFIESVSNLLGLYSDLQNNNIYLQDIFDYVDLPNNMYKGSLSVEKRDDNEYEIEFKNVSFKYPGTETYSLKNFNLKINIGQRMAVVGMNGSGKTTMIKLLCRLYDPTEGEITLNGIDIKKYKYDEYMGIFSVVFQDFKLFSFTLGQNVASSVEYDADRAEQYLKKSGFGDRFESLPKGLETALYRDFEDDGVEISGGEAQKIALARALYKDAPFIVLDEPTAALDPIAEFEIYSKFNEIVEDKTAIYISHRLSSCRFCDYIAVFHEGELIQRGNHDTLIADERGKYHELWNAQAQYYQENSETASATT